MWKKKTSKRMPLMPVTFPFNTQCKEVAIPRIIPPMAAQYKGLVSKSIIRKLLLFQKIPVIIKCQFTNQYLLLASIEEQFKQLKQIFLNTSILYPFYFFSYYIIGAYLNYFNIKNCQQSNTNSMNQSQPKSQEKILSTENSRNSTFTVLNQQMKNNQSCGSSLRLFTFMNLKNQDQFNKLNINLEKQKGQKNKSVRKISNKCLKRESSGLITMIQQSRKKRQDFLKLIIDNDPNLNLEKQRRCKTPTGFSSSNNNFSSKNFIYKKSHTPRAVNNTKRQSFAINESKSQIKLNSARASLYKIDTNLSYREQPKKPKKKDEKIVKKQKIENQQQTLLLKKKKDLEKQLLQINQTLMLGHNKKKAIGNGKKKL